MHIHSGVAHALNIFLLVLLVGTIWRLVAMKLSQTSVGQAMAFMY